MQKVQKCVTGLLHLADKIRLPIGLVLFFLTITVISIPVIAMAIMAIVVSTDTVLRNSHYEATANMVLIEQAIEDDFNKIFETLDKTATIINSNETFDLAEISALIEDTDYIEDVVYYNKMQNAVYSTDSYYVENNTYFSTSFFNQKVQPVFDRNTDTIMNEGIELGYFDSQKQILLTAIHFIKSENERQKYGFSFIKSLGDRGYICATINPQSLVQDFDDFFSYKDNDFMLVSIIDDIYVSNQIDRIGYTLHELSGYLGTYIADNSSEIYNMSNERVIVTTRSLDSFGFTLMLSTPYRYIDNFLEGTIRTIIIIFVISLLVAFIASFLIAKRISYPIVSLKKSMDQFAKGDMQTKSVIIGNNEITDLSRSFNFMTSEISNLINSLDTQKAIAENYRLRLTNEQTNPHFLYNVLEMIRSLINLNMHDQASEATGRLANFYRGSLSDGNDIITIEGELNFLNDYITLQKMRYVEQLETEITIDKSLYKYAIPKLTLQPLVENAIYHGIRKRKGKGLIKLNVVEQNDRVFISVQDNGVGINGKLQKELLALNCLSPITEHFGLSSILHRLNYHFNSDVQFNIVSKKDEYTIMELSIPKQSVAEIKGAK